MIRNTFLITILLMFSVQIYAQTCGVNITESTPDSRFTTNGSEVTDNETGLIWQGCSLGQTGSDCLTGSAQTYTWQGAMQAAETERQQTSVDWRLPNIRELLSITEDRCSYPAINLSIFPNTISTVSAGYWSASFFMPNSSYARYVNFRNGNSYYNLKSNRVYVRLVRTGQPSIILNPPIANAGTDQTVISGTNVTLNASESNDSDGTITSYEWKEGSTVLSNDISFTKSDFSVGVHTITLTVMDNDEATATDIVVITIEEVNIPPTAVDDILYVAADSFMINIDVLNNDSDSNGDTITIKTTTEPLYGSLILNSDKTHLAYTSKIGNKLDDDFIYTISDGNGGEDHAYVTIKTYSNHFYTIKNKPLESTGIEEVITTENMVLSVIEQPANGSVVLHTNGSFIYTPNIDFIGNDSFSYKTGNNNIITAIIKVHPEYIAVTENDMRYFVYDMNTKLTWQDSYPNNNDEIKTGTIQDAYEYCSSLTLGTLNDWRVPNFTELKSIINLSRDPVLDGTFQSRYIAGGLLGELVAYKWIHAYSDYGTTILTDDDNWKVDVILGSGAKSDGSSAIIKCVRGARIEETPHQYQRNLKGIVSDSKGLLEWQDNYGDNGGDIKQTNWNNAIDYCNNSILGGYNNWRLPALHEMSMLLQEQKNSSSFQFTNSTLIDANNYNYTYWTTFQGSDYAWVVDMNHLLYGHGFVTSALGANVGQKSEDASVRCVRSVEQIIDVSSLTDLVNEDTIGNSKIIDSIVNSIVLTKMATDVALKIVPDIELISLSNNYKLYSDLAYEQLDTSMLLENLGYDFDELLDNAISLEDKANSFLNSPTPQKFDAVGFLPLIGVTLDAISATNSLITLNDDRNRIALALAAKDVVSFGINVTEIIQTYNGTVTGSASSLASKVLFISGIAVAVAQGVDLWRDSLVKDEMKLLISEHQNILDKYALKMRELLDIYFSGVYTEEELITQFDFIFSDYKIQMTGYQIPVINLFHRYLNDEVFLQLKFGVSSQNNLEKKAIIEIAAFYTISEVVTMQMNQLSNKFVTLSNDIGYLERAIGIIGPNAYDVFRKISDVREQLVDDYEPILDIKYTYGLEFKTRTLKQFTKTGLATDEALMSNPDDDNDEIPDDWEITYNLNPLDSSDANLDADSDDYTNLEEYLGGTDPRDPLSVPVKFIVAPILYLLF